MYHILSYIRNCPERQILSQVIFSKFGSYRVILSASACWKIFRKTFLKHFYGIPATQSPFLIAFRGLFQRVKKGVEVGDKELGGRARMKKMLRRVTEILFWLKKRLKFGNT